MIQRIQSIYLILSVIALVACACFPVGTFVMRNQEVAEFMNWGIMMNNTMLDSSPWGMLAILLLSAIISVGTIILYKNRILQIRMTVFATILLVGYYITFTVFMFVLKGRLEALYQVGWALCLPIISIILNYLAIRAIGKDEVMVKAADRLR